MPTRSYYFPDDFAHLEAVLRGEAEPPSEEVLKVFRENNIPPIVDEGTLAVLLGISPKLLWSIRRKPSNHYRNFTIQKRDGTSRTINSPRTYLKVIQWWINDNILAQTEFPKYVFGFVPKRSIVDNAQYHYGANHVLNVDIRDFFPSISEAVVQSHFQKIGFSERVSDTLAQLCCLYGRLPQGAPTSPAIANLVLGELDVALNCLSELSGIRYSRYADDLTFSSQDRIEDDFVGEVSSQISLHGFELKHEKTRIAGRGDRMEVTGLTINEVVQPSRKWRKLCRAKVYRFSKKDRLTRRELSQLYGIKGVCSQFPESTSMNGLATAVSLAIEAKRDTVIGLGTTKQFPNGLSKREVEVLLLLRPDKSNWDIASSLEISEATIKKHLTSTFRKIGVDNRFDAFRWAKQNI